MVLTRSPSESKYRRSTNTANAFGPSARAPLPTRTTMNVGVQVVSLHRPPCASSQELLSGRVGFETTPPVHTSSVQLLWSLGLSESNAIGVAVPPTQRTSLQSPVVCPAV